jgi:hypothetical protein
MPEDREPRWDEETQRYLHWDAVLEKWVPLPDPPVVPEQYWDEERQRYVTVDAPPGNPYAR